MSGSVLMIFVAMVFAAVSPAVAENPRILVLGDSLSAAYGIPLERGWVNLLQTRLDFSSAYANELQAGADKLILADITEEGANLVALQTRQQLGISSLSFAGQAEQSILSLFR